ncbi:hypothetical protein SH580_16205 [Coraliomargarita algicola]|uniref:PDGLE domain-containing protein n=1 Tax=Coraliomargarita algicola TaxID=3092156 RepID=A0ABZ0RJ49_9BACT|nr:hypothetical protein [Coraliomargarita sp. J2-16]WPJ94972.1 hypothetical protein SH580_16205 [Coraliomargarita sp. J2-16]
MKTILYLASAICFAVTTAGASSITSSVLVEQPSAEEQILGLSEAATGRDEIAGAAVIAKERPAVSGFELNVDSELGSLALLAGFVGMTFVMIRRRQAS